MIDDRLHCSVRSHHNNPYQNNRKPEFSICVHHERGQQIYFIQVYKCLLHRNTSIMMWGTCNGQHMMGHKKREREWERVGHRCWRAEAIRLLQRVVNKWHLPRASKNSSSELSTDSWAMFCMRQWEALCLRRVAKGRTWKRYDQTKGH